MKRSTTSYALSILIIFLSLFSSCKKDEGIVGGYSASLRAWKVFKSSVNDTYQYGVVSNSWTGYTAETTISVKNGQVIQRFFTAKTTNGQTGVATIVEQWIEEGATLNTHQMGAATLTIDAVYTKAKNEWLVKSEDKETYFETKNGGMISTAGYWNKGCMDDCFTGINISFIRKNINIL